MACSREVNGPDSTTSVDNAPVSPTASNTHKFEVIANAMPATANPAYSVAYSRRRPIRSAYLPTTNDINAVPTRIAANSTPTRVVDHPLEARVTPSTTEVNP